VRCFARDGDLYIEHEAYGHGIELTDLAAFFRKVPGAERWKIWADSARPETISFMRNQGWNIEAAPKWSGSVEDGIEFMRSFRRIVIHPRCKNVINEFNTYSYKVDKKTEEILPIVMDEKNHTIDAIRYSLSNLIKRKVTIYDPGFF
jgi:phage terminase large subunit